MTKEIKTFNVKVVNAEEIMIDTPALALSAMNQKGKFDILPKHQPFICLLERGDVIIRKPGKEVETVSINKGILRVADNEAVIMVDL